MREREEDKRAGWMREERAREMATLGRIRTRDAR